MSESICELLGHEWLMPRSYEHHNINEPAILLGGSFMVDVAENSEEFGKQQESKNSS